MQAHTETFEIQQGITNEHYHCYLLRSQDPTHPHKTYVGFTTNPHRRIRQHNGLLKHGGAWRTKRAGRPWEFAVIVHGFPTQKIALQFEWAWQHCDRSLAVRAVIGDEAAGKLKRKRGLRGQLEILKTMLFQCPDLFSNHNLHLFFFQESIKSIYERIPVEPSEHALRISMQLVSSLEVMPFYPTRNRPTRRLGQHVASSKDDEDRDEDGEDAAEMALTARDINLQSRLECLWCHRSILETDLSYCFRCWSCKGAFHEICADVQFFHGETTCPKCDNPLRDIDWDSTDESSTGQVFETKSRVATMPCHESYVIVQPNARNTDLTTEPGERSSLSREALSTNVDSELDDSSIEVLESSPASPELSFFGSSKPSRRIFGPRSPNSSSRTRRSAIASSPTFLPPLNPRKFQDMSLDSPSPSFLSPLTPIKFQDMSLDSPNDQSSTLRKSLSPTLIDYSRNSRTRPSKCLPQDHSIVCIDSDDTASDDSLCLPTCRNDLRHVKPRQPDVIDICSPY